MFYLFLMVVAIGAAFLGHYLTGSRDPDAVTFGTVLRTFAVAVAVLLSIFSAAYQVPTGHVGIVYQFGSIVGQRPEGLQWVWPWQGIEKASIQVTRKTYDRMAAASAQSQDVFATITLNTRVSPENIQRLYRTVGPNWYEVLVAPRVTQVFKAETVKHQTLSVLPNREQIRNAVTVQLSKELAERSIIVEDVLLENIGFSDEFQKEIEQTQVAAQEAKREFENVVKQRNIADQEIEKARGRAESVLVEAKAQAEANITLAKSITPELVQYQMVTKLSPNVQVMMVPNGQQFIMPADAFRTSTEARR